MSIHAGPSGAEHVDLTAIDDLKDPVRPPAPRVDISGTSTSGVKRPRCDDCWRLEEQLATSKNECEQLVEQIDTLFKRNDTLEKERNLRDARQLEHSVQGRASAASHGVQQYLAALELQRRSSGRVMGQLCAIKAGQGANRSPCSSWLESEGGIIRDKHPLTVCRAQLGHDLLRVLSQFSRPYQLFCSPCVTFAGEDGVDMNGLTVNFFALAFAALRAIELTPAGGPGAAGSSSQRLFQEYKSSLNLPARHADESDPASPRLVICRPAAGSGASAGAAGVHPWPLCDSIEAWRLIGRLLAWQLRQPVGRYIDDRLPSFVLEFLATGRMGSIEQVEGAFAAVREMHGESDPVWQHTRACLDKPFTEMATIMGGDPTLSDLLPHGYWECCALCPSADSCPCGLTVLNDEDKQAWLVEGVRHCYLTSRQHYLDALKRGFDGDGLAQDEWAAADLGALLSIMPPAALAVRLRGEPIKSGRQLLKEIDVLRQKADCEELKWAAATADEYERVRGWLEAYVCDLTDHGAKLLLAFMTGSKALPPSESRPADYSRPSILVYNDWHFPGSADAHLPTASTCIKQLYMPVYPSREAFVAKFRTALADFQVGEESRPGGSSLGYS